MKYSEIRNNLDTWPKSQTLALNNILKLDLWMCFLLAVTLNEAWQSATHRDKRVLLGWPQIHMCLLDPFFNNKGFF